MSKYSERANEEGTRPNDVRPLIDETDRRILKVLAVEARIPNNALADRVGIAPSTCLGRVRSLVERGVIRGFYADIDPAAVGHSLQAIIAVRLQADARDAISLSPEDKISSCMWLLKIRRNFGSSLLSTSAAVPKWPRLKQTSSSSTSTFSGSESSARWPSPFPLFESRLPVKVLFDFRGEIRRVTVAEPQVLPPSIGCSSVTRGALISNPYLTYLPTSTRVEHDPVGVQVGQSHRQTMNIRFRGLRRSVRRGTCPAQRTSTR
jgi:DNA-binding Lrp family transcriptional regulator